MPLLETKGAGSAQGYGEFTASAPKVYIEDVFSTYLYTGNGSTQTITNGIDLSTKGGLVWAKNRSSAGYDHVLTDTIRGAGNLLSSNNTSASQSLSNTLTAFGSTGFTLGSDPYGIINYSGQTYASWTFRKQPKFFDVVTYTGDGANKTVSHNLGSVPGCIIIKDTTNAYNWTVYHRSLATGEYLVLNSTGAAVSTGGDNVIWNVTSTSFNVASYYGLSYSGDNYVAYLFAHDAGGFGLSGTDNVISCGSYTGNGSSTGPTVTLGYEPQWVMVKRTDTTSNWFMLDIMRGIPNTPGVAAGSAYLFPNTSGAEDSAYAPFAALSATGFSLLTSNANLNASGGTYIYIAIRRGPMKVPTSGTSVFTPVQNSNFTAGVVIAGQSVIDASWSKQKDAVNAMRIFDRLRGSSTSANYTLVPSSTAAEFNEAYWALDQQNGVRITQTLGTFNYINYFFSRAPGFFDVVCYTGTGAILSVNHNLGVAPELIIVKRRSGADGWYVGTAFTPSNYIDVQLQSSNNGNTNSYPNEFNSQPTASAFTVFNFGNLSGSGATYVAYLFATAAGVSKVGSYTGTGTTKQIDCGFTGGARFILIKRIDSTGDWYVYDTARGIVAGNDSYLFLNSAAAEVTNTDYIDPYSAGFELSSTAPAGLNANGGTFVFLAIS